MLDAATSWKNMVIIVAMTSSNTEVENISISNPYVKCEFWFLGPSLIVRPSQVHSLKTDPEEPNISRVWLTVVL